MSNPLIDKLVEKYGAPGGLELPPIGVVDPEPDNPLIRALQEKQKGTGRGLLTEAETHAERVAGSLAIIGSVGHGIVKPISGILGFPGALGRGLGLMNETDQIITDRMARVVTDWNSGVRDRWETRASELGFSEEEIRGTRMLGETVGFLAPGVMLYKGVGRAMGITGEGMARLPFMAGLKVDITAGLVWGGALTEGEMADRFRNAAIDGGLSAGVGLALGGVWPALSAYRATRIANQNFMREHKAAQRKGLFSFYQTRRHGEAPPIIETPAEARSVFELMSEESIFVNSPAAVEILVRSANEEALVQGIIDLAGSRGSAGLVREVGLTFPEAVTIADRFRAQFPELKFTELRNPEGGFDVHFGARGLNAGQRRQYGQEGRYAGQRLLRDDGVEMEYVGLASEKGKIRVKALDTGKGHTLGAKRFTSMFYGTEPGKRFPRDDALYQDFAEFFRERSAQVLNERYNLSEADLVRLAREGRLSDEILGHRRVVEPNAVTMPWEVEGRPPTPKEFHPHYKEMLRQELIRLDDETQNLVKQYGGGGPGPDWPPEAIIQFDALERKYHPMMQDFISLQTAEDIIKHEGTEAAWLLHPWEGVSFEDTVALWASERGISTTSGEFVSMQADFAARMRSKLLDDFARDFPEESVTLTALKAEWDALIGAEGLSLEAQAAVKGFHLQPQPNGSFTLRDINTGALWAFADEASVEAAIRAAVRGDRDSIVSALPPNTISAVMSPSAVVATPVEEILADMLPENALHKQMSEDIPTRIITNVRDLLIKYQDRTGMPLWRLGFQQIDEGGIKNLQEFSILGRDAENAFFGNGIKNRKARLRIAEYFTRVYQSEDLIPTQRYAVARDLKLTREEQKAVKEMTRAWNAAFKEYGVSGSAEDYLRDYYGRMLPKAQELGHPPSRDEMLAMFGGEMPAHFEHFSSHLTHGALAQMEPDPLIVMLKWLKTAGFNRHLEKPWQALYKMINTRVRDLPKDQRMKFENAADRVVDINETVIPEPLGNIIKEYLLSIRGAPLTSVKSTQSFFQKIYKKLGIEVDERVTTEFFNMMLATMYGSAMGARPMLVARNHLQTMWNLYPRLGGKFYGAAMERAMTPDGFRKSIDALAIRSPQAGLPLHDEVYESLIDAGAHGTGLFSNALAAAMNFSLSLGRVSRKVAEKALVPYGMGDNFSRSWAFWYQRLHTEHFLEQTKRATNPLSKADFYDKGLPFYDKAIREEFEKRWRYQSEEAALDFIGRMASDETHFIYGMGVQPTWMQNPFGKFMGMFGTWPLWQKEVTMRLMRNGTRGQKTAAWARTAGIGGALGLVGYSMGVQVSSWMAPAWFTWTGGPGLDHLINLKQIIDAPMDRKASSIESLGRQLTRLALPGQVLMTDLQKAGEATEDPALAAFYIFLGRPRDKSFLDIEFMHRPPVEPKTIATPAAPVSTVDSRVLDFGISQESMGLAPRGATSTSISTTTPRNRYEEVMQYLGGNVPR